MLPFSRCPGVGRRAHAGNVAEWSGPCRLSAVGQELRLAGRESLFEGITRLARCHLRTHDGKLELGQRHVGHGPRHRVLIAIRSGPQSQIAPPCRAHAEACPLELHDAGPQH
eukprot:319797-Alexandrium_andersonii.AAC.1